MKKIVFHLPPQCHQLVAAALFLTLVARGAEAPFTEATFTEVTGEVSTAKPTDAASKLNAKLNDIFHAPDILQTGRRSRAQLTAADGTIARIGSNTVFSLEPTSRTIHLSEGSILFNSPKGMGGGTIVTNSATATVTGTTIIVAATSNGGFKVLVLEGTAKVTFPGGQVVTIGAGQMTFVMPAAKTGGSSTGGGASKSGAPGPVLNFDLAAMTSGSGLVNGFSTPLPSTSLILDATHGQQVQISSGDLNKTGQAVVGASSSTQILLVDSSVIQSALDSSVPDPKYANDQLGRALASNLDLQPEGVVPPDNVFLDPVTFTAADLGITIPQVINSKGQVSIQGLIAGNIYTSGDLDLSAFDGLSEIDLYAGYYLGFNTDTTFFLPDSTHRLGLFGQQIYFYPGTELDFEFGNNDDLAFHPSIVPHDTFFGEDNKVEIGSRDSMSLTGVEVTNPSGSLHFTSLAGNVNLTEAFVRGAEGELELNAPQGAISIDESTVSGGDGFAALLTANGSISVHDSDLEASNRDGSNFGLIGLTSFANVTVQGSDLRGDGLRALAGGVLTLNNVDLGGMNSSSFIQLAAPTINLSDVDFPGESQVHIYTKFGVLAGDPNDDSDSVVGDVNFLNNVTYDGDPAEGFIGDGITLGVTADNPGVQSALGTTVNLNTESVSEDNTFTNVFFTPANIGRYKNAIHPDSLVVDYGVIAGTLVLGGNVDLNNVSNPDEHGDLQLVGLSNITFNGSVNLSVPSLLSSIDFWSRNINFAPNSNITAQFDDEEGDLSFTSLGKLNMTHVALTNSFGGISLSSLEDDVVLADTSINAEEFLDLFTGGDAADVVLTNTHLVSQDDEIDISGDGVVATNSTIEAEFDVFIDGNKRGVTLNSTDIHSDDEDVTISGRFVTLSQGSVSVFNSESNNIIQVSALTDVAITGTNLDTDGGGYIQLEGGQTVTVKNGMLSTPQIMADAGDRITMSNVDVSSANEINMSARTIVLSDINFKNGSSVNLNSENGMLAPNPNTNRAPVVGDVNFIKNVNYGGQPAQNFVPISAGGSSSNTEAPIQIHSNSIH